jgi:hypothetical protein
VRACLRDLGGGFQGGKSGMAVRPSQFDCQYFSIYSRPPPNTQSQKTGSSKKGVLTW